MKTDGNKNRKIEKIIENKTRYQNGDVSDSLKKYFHNSFLYDCLIFNFNQDSTLQAATKKIYNMKKKNEYSLNKKTFTISSKKSGTDWVKINNELKDTNILYTTIILNINVTNNLFYDSYLKPLEMYLINELKLDLKIHDNYDLILDSLGLPAEMKKYIVNKKIDSKENAKKDKIINLITKE